MHGGPLKKRSGTPSRTLRAATVLAVMVVASVAWVAYRTVEQAQVSRSIRPAHARGADVARGGARDRAGRRGRRTQLHSLVGFSNARAVRIERNAPPREGINQLAILTADNPNQQARVPELRQEAAQALAALRVVADAKRAARAIDPTDTDAAQARIAAAREHRSGDARGGESSSWGPRAGEPRGGSPSPADPDRARRGRRRTARMGDLAHRRQRSSSTERRRYPASRE